MLVLSRTEVSGRKQALLKASPLTPYLGREWSQSSRREQRLGVAVTGTIPIRSVFGPHSLGGPSLCPLNSMAASYRQKAMVCLPSSLTAPTPLGSLP